MRHDSDAEKQHLDRKREMKTRNLLNRSADTRVTSQATPNRKMRNSLNNDNELSNSIFLQKMSEIGSSMMLN